MIRIAALNDSSSGGDSDEDQAPAVGTKEAEESEAYTLYNRALSLQRQDLHKAEDAFEQLLSHAFIREAAKLIENEAFDAVHPGLQLLYSIYKNLASMAQQQGEHETAIEWYIEAVKVDETEVTVWYKIGTMALKLHNYQLARLGFEQGLQCNPNHWPCLDNVITVLYTMNDYWYCLYFIAKALKKDHLYPKGLAFCRQILKEQPSLEEYTKDLFTECDPSIHNAEIDEEEAKEYIDEALTMREKRRELAKEPPSKPYNLPLPVKCFTWKCVGESLLALYDKIKASNPPMSMGLRVDLSEYLPKSESVEVLTENKAEEKMEIEESQSFEVGDVNPVKSDTVETNTPKDDEKVLDQEPVTMETTPAKETITSEISSSTSSSGSCVTVTATVVNIPAAMATEEPVLSMSNPTTPTTCTPSVADAFNLDQPSSGVSDTDSRGKPQKRKRGLPLDVDLYGKRRSARVRNTFKTKEEEKINFHELLMNFLPQSLKMSDDEEMDGFSMATNNQSIHQDRQDFSDTKEDVDRSGCNHLTTTEEADVMRFLQEEQKNGGALGLMKSYVDKLAQKYDVVWPKDLIPVFLNVHTKLRKHFDLPCLYSKDDPDAYLNDIGKASLLSAELHLDRWLTSRPKKTPDSPRRTSQSAQYLQLQDLPANVEEDVSFMSEITAFPEVLADHYWPFSVRVYWMKSRFYMLQGETEDAMCCFNRTKYSLEQMKEEDNITQVVLPNCQIDNLVTLEIVTTQEESLQRSQSMEETQKLYQSGQYQKVADFLIQMFSQPHVKHLAMKAGSSEMDRIDQLLLLQDCLTKLQQYEKAVYWGEVSFNEALQEYCSAKTSVVKEQWSKTMHQIWSDMLRMIELDVGALIGLPPSLMVRLSGNLVSVINTMMTVPEIATDMPIGSVLPWLLLYRVIEHEERRLKLTGEERKEEEEETIPSSLMLLNNAHEYLGRHSWCTKSDGAVIKFYMEILKKKMQEKSKFKNDFRQAYEQCIYCLYGHPNKKGRARHLLEHNAPQVELTWEVAVDIFELFRPQTLPEFDSVKAETVSADLESLYRRITLLVPESEKTTRWMEAVQNYIDGETNEAPSSVLDNVSPVSQEIYYLLADYYGKNIEHAKAIKYYMCDLCINPTRLDSWAGMALARMCQLEQKLNATELKMDVPVHKRAISALRCFRRAVEIEDASGKLWMEYGSLSYQMHSHASRQLQYHQEKKEELDEDFLDSEFLQICQDSKQEMLKTAYNCYKNASECEDEESEEWLTQYMMGKCVEKMKKSPQEYLQHYKLAAEALHEENATYPKKIAYAYTAHTSPRLAVEALEMFYRLHVSILKLLLKGKQEENYENYQKFIDEAAESPFAKGIEKKAENKDGFQPASEISSAQNPKNKSTTTQQDHTYSKQKNCTSISENLKKAQDSTISESVVDIKCEEKVDVTTSVSEDVATVEASIKDVEKQNNEAVDSAEEKMADSADESRDSSDYFPSNESDAESEDSHPDMDIDIKEVLDFVPSLASHPQGKISPVIPVTLARSTMMELSADLLESSQGSKPDVVRTYHGSDEEKFLNTANVENSLTESQEGGAKEVNIYSAAVKNVENTDMKTMVEEGSLTKQISEGFTVQEVDSKEGMMELYDAKLCPHSGEREGNSSHGSNSSKAQKVTESEREVRDVIEIFSSPEPGRSEKFFASDISIDIAQEGKKESESKEEEKSDTIKIKVAVIDFTGEKVIAKVESLQTDDDAMDIMETTKTVDTGLDRSSPHVTTNHCQEERSSASVSPNQVQADRSSPQISSNQDVEDRSSADVLTIKNLGDKSTSGQPHRPSSDDSVIMLDSESERSESEVMQTKSESKTILQTQEGSVISLSAEKLNVMETSLQSQDQKNSDLKSTAQVSKHNNEDAKNKTVEEANGTIPTKPEDDKSVSPKNEGEGPSKKALTGDALHRDLIEKCLAALRLCLSRFPTHYKSLYRLAYVYFYSPYHKNLQCAKDLLFGTPNWQSLSYMPAQGLFNERKLNNFFQGTWKLPIDEVERSGSFATHLNKAVLLLLKILCEQKDVHTLYHVHLQLNKMPESGKKYLRDGERIHYSKLAFNYCLEAVKARIPDVRNMADKEKAVRSLMETYRIWNYGISKHKHLGPRVNNLLAATFKAVMKENVNPDKPVLEQARVFCQNRQQQITMSRQQHQSGGKTNQDKDSGNQSSDSSFMSPDRLFSQSNLASPLRASPAQISVLSKTNTPSTTTSLSKSSQKASDVMSTDLFATDGEEKGVKVKMSISSDTEQHEDPFNQLKTPPTPVLADVTDGSSQKGVGFKAVSTTSETGLSSAPKMVIKPDIKSLDQTIKVTPITSDEVIEILSSSEEDETALDKKHSKIEEEEINEQLDTQKQINDDNMQTSEDHQTDAEKDAPLAADPNVKGDNTTSKSELSPSHPSDGPQSKKMVESETSSVSVQSGQNLDILFPETSTIHENQISGDLNPPTTEDDQASIGPYLDPSTGLFVTDSDSQSSNFIANPENLSFDMEGLMDVDG